MSQPPDITQSSASASGLESSFEMLFEKALEKVVNNAITQINEASANAIDEAVKSSVKNILENAVESAVEDAVSSVVESAFEDAVETVVKKAVEKAVETAVEKIVDKTIKKAVDSAVEQAVEKHIAKYLDRSQERTSTDLTGQRDAKQNVSQTDVISEIPETQQQPMEVDLVTGNIVGANEHKHDDDPEHEEAALREILARNPDFTNQHPWPHYISRIDVVYRYTFVLAVNESLQPVVRSLSYTVYNEELRDSYKWECIEANGWLRFRNTANQKYLGICRLYGEEKFLLCLFDTMVDKTRFCLRLQSEWSALLVVPMGGELRSLKAIPNLEKLHLDPSIEGAFLVVPSNDTDSHATLIHVCRGRKIELQDAFYYDYDVSD